ncbi:hypothetical protein QJS04_geneDACA022049 [Acorus gramineus]|uniref:Uncharacterized protein n=1 Tax=Acorus gramineus TaxID=55184 RepID=A0AAV9B6K4_ACOGR|nr:hypothetical protein QJS04_geneDACA022049 [Acorus gramineus]
MKFLEGLQAPGRREWAGIARDYVVTRNAAQVASHAQKHFMYQSKNAGKQRRGSSIFDLPPPPPQPAPQRQMNNVENPTPSHSDDGVDQKKCVSVRWTKEEHIKFLEGLQALGRGEWAGIAKDYVITKNTTQVTSHAQKHFLHQSKNAVNQCKDSSIFDLHPRPPPPQREMNNVDNPTPVHVHIPVWMHIGPIRPNMQRE